MSQSYPEWAIKHVSHDTHATFSFDGLFMGKIKKLSHQAFIEKWYINLICIMFLVKWNLLISMTISINWGEMTKHRSVTIFHSSVAVHWAFVRNIFTYFGHLVPCVVHVQCALPFTPTTVWSISQELRSYESLVTQAKLLAKYTFKNVLGQRVFSSLDSEAIFNCYDIKYPR